MKDYYLSQHGNNLSTDLRFSGGLDVHWSEDFNFHLHCGAISSHSRLPHARNTGQSVKYPLITDGDTFAVIYD